MHKPKAMTYKPIIIGLLLLTASQTAMAQAGAGAAATATTAANPHTTIGQERVLPLITTKIQLLTRSYADSIVLRWVAEDYVSYNYLATFGVNVLRVPHDSASPGIQIDTLAYALKPTPLDEFRRKYAPSDSMAYVAMNVLYGEEKENIHKEHGQMGNTMDVSSDQDIAFGVSMLTAEWRKDLAEDLAVRFTDRHVQPGMTYDYYVQPTVWPENGRLIFEPGVVENVAPASAATIGAIGQEAGGSAGATSVRMTDSISNPHTLTIGWWDSAHSSFEIERRQVTDLVGRAVQGQWERATKKPYVSMVQQPDDETYCLFADSVPELGLWEYRILGYDAFADLNELGTHSVFVPDVEPPLPPVLKRIVIERPDDSDPMAKVIAHVVWEKPYVEEDMAGYRIYYQPMQRNAESWQLMTPELLPATDTICALDMTGRRTGMMYVAAYDHAGNEAKSFVQQIRLTDFRAPAPPQSLRAVVRPLEIDSATSRVLTDWAFIDIFWQPLAEDDDIDYFDIAFANDSTHEFLVRNEGGIRQNMFTDSVALNANQKYIYYKVRAIDYSTNVGQWTDWIRVERPHITPPTRPHLGHSEHSDENGMHMEWIVGADADMKRHVLYRRLGETGKWEILAKFNADSVRATDNTIIYKDNPPYSQTQRYYYFLKSVNASPFSSSSLAVSWRHRGPRVLDVPIQLVGSYTDGTVLTWEVAESNLPAGDWHFCIYRKGPADKRFQYYMSAAATDRRYVEHTLQKGQTAQYYVELRFDDGRHSQESNTVSVTAGE